MSPPLVSIIIPAYNAEKYIADTIQSVLAQTYTNWELIVVDDGSTDHTAHIIQSFINDERIYYVYQPNSGVSAARNKGISIAKGKYVAFLDADDLWTKDNLEKKIKIFETEKYSGVFSDCIIKDFENHTEILDKGCNTNIKKRLLEFIPNTLPGTLSNLILKREWIEKMGGFDMYLSTSADWDFAVRLAHLTSLGYIPEPLVIYRSHPNQMHKNIPLMEKDMLYAFQKARKNGLFTNTLHYYYCQSKLSLVLAGSYFHHTNQYHKVLWHLIRSLVYHPLPILQKLKNILGLLRN